MINYKKYSIAELKDVYQKIDREKYPENYEQLVEEFRKRNIDPIKSDDPVVTNKLLLKYHKFLMNESMVKQITKGIFLIVVILLIVVTVYFTNTQSYSSNNEKSVFGLLFVIFLFITTLSLISGEVNKPKIKFINEPGLFILALLIQIGLCILLFYFWYRT